MVIFNSRFRRVARLYFTGARGPATGVLPAARGPEAAQESEEAEFGRHGRATRGVADG